MNGTNRGAIRAYAAFSNDLIDLIVKDYPLDLFEDPFPILEAQPDPVWAGHPVWSRNAVKLMSALLPVVEGRFDCNPYVHGSPPYKELTLAQARSPTTTPMFCPLPLNAQCAGFKGNATAARIAASEGQGAVFAPLALGGAGGLRSAGPPAERLVRWFKGMDSAVLTAMRHLDDVEAWEEHAQSVTAVLSGRTPAALLKALTEWPLLSAPVAETLTGASRAAIQRNLGWLETRGLVREVTGQGRFRMWRAAV